MTASSKTITRTSNPKGIAGTTYNYSNYLNTAAEVTATDFFDDVPQVNLKTNDLMKALLQDGWFYLRFTSPTTAAIDAS